MVSSEYPSDWDSRRQEVYSRDDHTCQNCGRTGGPRGSAELHAHHIVPKSKSGTHAETNLVTVCEDCHDAIHGKSHAPSASASVRTTGGDDYFDTAGSLVRAMSDLQKLSAKYSISLSKALNGNTSAIAETDALERDLRKKCFDLKVKLASFDVYDAPSRVTDRYVSMMEEFVEMNLDVIDGLISLVDDANRVVEAAESADEFSCPSCEATVAEGDSFCGACGTELPAFGACEECGADVEATADYCSDCGAELEDDSRRSPDLDALAEEATEQARSVSRKTDRMTVFSQKLTAETSIVNQSSGVSDVDWEYCPNCGYEYGVFAFETRTAECILCRATWEKNGLVSPKWEMTEGDHAGESKSNEDWQSLGESKNADDAYEEYVESFGLGDVKRLQRKL